MRLIIVSEEVPEVGGVYIGPPNTERENAVVNEWVRLLTTGTPSDLAGALFGPAAVGAVVAGVVGAPVAGVAYLIYGLLRDTKGDRLEKALPEVLRLVYRQGAKDAQTSPLLGSDQGEVLGLMISAAESAQSLHPKPFERFCISVLPRRLGPAADVPPFNALAFQGAFSTAEQLGGILEADGGNSQVHLVARNVARELFRRHGGGVLEAGRYVLHPKRENTLVPLDTFHTDMLQELTREIRIVMGRIGARRLEVETLEGVTFSGQVVSRIPLKSGAAQVDGSEQKERRITYDWASPTYQPAEALEDCVWIRDNPSAMAIFDQRRTSDLSTYEEYSQVDTTFHVALDVMKLFKADFNWSSKSTYRYSVEFFPRSK